MSLTEKCQMNCFYLGMSLLELATLLAQYNDNDNLHSICFALYILKFLLYLKSRGKFVSQKFFWQIYDILRNVLFVRIELKLIEVAFFLTKFYREILYRQKFYFKNILWKNGGFR